MARVRVCDFCGRDAWVHKQGLDERRCAGTDQAGDDGGVKVMPQTSNFFTADGAALTSNREDWETPQALFNELDKVYHFTLDPCATDSNHKCAKYYTKEQDGLKQDWTGEVVFCNPPYGRNIGAWVKKCAEADATVVMLIPARTDTSYFHDYIYGKADILFLRGRLKFELGGVAQRSAAPFPSMIVTYKKH